MSLGVKSLLHPPTHSMIFLEVSNSLVNSKKWIVELCLDNYCLYLFSGM